MLVHIVNSANRSSYIDYLDDMFEMRKNNNNQFFSEGFNSDSEFDIDEFDNIEEVEYLLLIDNFGELAASCRLLPSIKPILADGVLKRFYQKEFEKSFNCWEVSKLNIRESENNKIENQRFAYILCGIIEWALMRQIKRIISVFDKKIISLFSYIGVEHSSLGRALNYKKNKPAIAIEQKINFNSLENIRDYYRVENSVSYFSPPPSRGMLINKNITRFLSAALEANKLTDMYDPFNVIN